MNRSDLARFWEKVAVGQKHECWLWLAAKTRKGYGTFKFRGRTMQAHRVAMIIDGRGIPDGLVVDHKCKNRSCVNPNHLHAVTARQNVLENSESLAAHNIRKSHCPRGHPYDEANTCVVGNRRHCRACANLLARKRRKERG